MRILFLIFSLFGVIAANAQTKFGQDITTTGAGRLTLNVSEIRYVLAKPGSNTTEIYYGSNLEVYRTSTAIGTIYNASCSNFVQLSIVYNGTQYSALIHPRFMFKVDVVQSTGQTRIVLTNNAVFYTTSSYAVVSNLFASCIASGSGGGGGGGGSTNLTFIQDGSKYILQSSSGTDVEFQPGTGIGISLVGSTLTVTNTGDTDAGNDITTSTSFSGDVAGLYNNLQIQPGAVGTTEVANGSITPAKLSFSPLTTEVDGVVGNEYNTSMSANAPLGNLSITDPGGTVGVPILSIAPIQSLSWTSPLTSTPAPGGAFTVGIGQAGAVSGQALLWNGTSWAPGNVAVSTEQPCVDTISVAGILPAVVVGTPLIRKTAGVWDNISGYLTSDIPTAVVVKLLGGGQAVVANCGAYQTALPAGGYYADSVSTSGFTTTAPAGIIRPAYVVDASGVLTPTLNLAFSTSAVSGGGGNTAFVASGGNLSITDGDGTLSVPVVSIAPVQSVAAGTGISVGSASGTFTVTNTGDTDASNDITTSTAANGDLTGTYPNPNVDGLQGRPVSGAAPIAGQVLEWTGSAWAPGTDDVGAGGSATDLSFTGTSSPITLNSSTGADVNFAAGSGVVLSQGTSTLTIAASDPSATNELNTGVSVASGNLSVTDPGGSVSVPVISIAPVQSVAAGTGISVGSAAGTFTVTNTGDTDASNDITTSTAANGDLTGTYPNPNVDGLQGRPVSGAAPTSGQVLKWDGTAWVPAADAGGAISTASPIIGDGTGGSPVGLATSGVTPGVYGSGTIPVFQVDTYGRLTSAGNNSIPDGSNANEGIVGVSAGNASTSIITSNTTGAVGVTIQAPAAGISLSETTSSNGGTITLALSNDLAAVEGLAASGIAVRTAADTWTTRTVASGAGISVSNGNGVSGNITVTNTGDTDASNDITTSTAANGDLTGTYPNPSVDGLQGNPVASTAPTSGQVLKWDGTAWAPAADATGGGGGGPIITTAPLTGDGSVGDPITMVALGATPSFLVWDGTEWVGAAISTDATISGNGISTPISIAQQSATTGQVLKWNGTSWAPAADAGGATDLSFTGTSSPVTLNSSTGADVDFAAGSGVVLSQGTNTLTIAASDPSATNELNTGISVASGNLSVTDPGGSVSVPVVSIAPVQSVAAGTGISVGSAAGTFTVTNTGDTDASNDITTSTAANGDLTGTYPNPNVDGLQGNPVASTAPTSGQVLKWDGAAWSPAADATGTDAQTLTFSNPNLSISGGNSADLSSVNYWSKTANDLSYTSGSASVGVASTAARFVTRGSGTSSATLSLAAQNSSGVNVMRVFDDNRVHLGGLNPSSGAARLQVDLNSVSDRISIFDESFNYAFQIRKDGYFSIGGNSAAMGTGMGTLDYNVNGTFLKIETPSTGATIDNQNVGQLSVFGRGSTAATGNTTLFMVGMRSGGEFSPSSGNRSLTSLRIEPKINQTSAANGNVYGVIYDPSITSILGNHYCFVSVPQTLNGIGTSAPTSTMDLNGAQGHSQLRLRSTYTPTGSSDANGESGQVAHDASAIYVKTASGWRMSDLEAFGTRRAFIEGVAASSVDLDANTGVVKDVNGNNVVFLPPSNLENLMVFKNGVLLNQDGTVTTRDYSINVGTNTIVFNVALLSTDRITIQR